MRVENVFAKRNYHRCLRSIGIILCWLTCWPAAAADSTGRSMSETYQVREFRHIDREYVGQALERVNQLAGERFGERLSGSPERDIALLQRLLDARAVPFDDLQLLQSMGIALGEIIRPQRNLIWVRYIDGKGASRALQLKREPLFIYPVTAISRRAAVGAPVDVEAIYKRALDRVDEHIEEQRYR
ncbi:MAG: DUF3806 domain-containing protein [Gammaproteobacteria bacterium]|nr:DUF3806 domain-containing protein [Gammaproteobacteria bacterium]MBT8152278.1 DUF3806 domain-containing protein [Gammaproteobacteria bacterium]NND38607.1 DUF3806 domain-containing protein [Pseudomonadales bacterium]NNM11344.1 DUF3806 domain-containing protein [Pseudomonadales bacterium]